MASASTQPSQPKSQTKAKTKNASPKDILVGGVLQMIEGTTLGMPLEVWKTQQGAYPKEGCITAWKKLFNSGGVGAFYRGNTAKLLESFSKGAVLLYSKELIFDFCGLFGLRRGDALPGAIAGAGGGMCQTVVMAPLTYVVTFKLKNREMAHLSSTQVLIRAGFKKAYGSALPVALRQASNWALRQAFADGLLN